MNRWHGVVLVGCAAALLGAGCGGGKQDPAAEGRMDELTAMSADEVDPAPARAERIRRMNASRAALKNQAPRPTVEMMAVNRVKDLLPAQLLGMRRGSVEAQKQDLSHLSTAEVVAHYGRNAKRSVEISINDLAGIGHLAGLPTLPWVDRSIDERTETGHARTFSVDGHQGYEEYDEQERGLYVQLLLNRRVLVEIEGRDVGDDEIAAIIQALPLRGISNLAPALQGTPGYIDVRPAPPDA